MTDERMALIEQIEKQTDIDLVRDILAYAAVRIMTVEVELRTGAAKGARSPLREVQRNGYRERYWEDPEVAQGPAGHRTTGVQRRPSALTVSLDAERSGARPGQAARDRRGDVETIFAQDTKAKAEAQWIVVADALRKKQPKLGAFMDASRDEVLAYMSFPREHWTQIASTNPLERVNRGIRRWADVIGIFPNDEAIIRLVGALMLETNDKWAVARRDMSLETLAGVTDNPNVRLPAVVA